MTMPTPTYDLRPLAPPQRHQLAFQCFDTLAMGEAFELINDHEPRGLLMQFAQQRANAFDWRVVEAAPGAWRIRIARVDASTAAYAERSAGCGGTCGCGG